MGVQNQECSLSRVLNIWIQILTCGLIQIISARIADDNNVRNAKVLIIFGERIFFIPVRHGISFQSVYHLHKINWEIGVKSL